MADAASQQAGVLRELERKLHHENHIQDDSERKTNVRYRDADWGITYFAEPFGDSYKVIRIKIGPPFDLAEIAAECDDPPGGPKARGVATAIATLWPDGIPKGLAGKERNNQVRDWLVGNGHSVPANIERAVQRALEGA